MYPSNSSRAFQPQLSSLSPSGINSNVASKTLSKNSNNINRAVPNVGASVSATHYSLSSVDPNGSFITPPSSLSSSSSVSSSMVTAQPYIISACNLVPPPPYSAIFTDSHIAECDDVKCITDEARDVHLSDDYDDDGNYDVNSDNDNGDDDNNYKECNEPLDLSVRRLCSASCSSARSFHKRPSVIRNNHPLATRNVDSIHRSASSVGSRTTPEPDVSEHFRRSLSGKWPRRCSVHTHYTPLQTEKERSKSNGLSIQLRAGQSFSNSTTNHNRLSKYLFSPLQKCQQFIVNNSGIEIEDHFRKALGEAAYERLRHSRKKKESS
ncbi:hypothetical protein AB6A40_003141 [Gnathostoma spinigerum]|uniref:Uncharacterized protein n=1 Tax=Gnathostoma spinigerum TaxID=75299 RepID=A0ABD6EIN8_9BILA